MKSLSSRIGEKSETTEEKYEKSEEKEKSSPMTPKVKSFVAMKKSEEKEKSSPMTPKVKSFVAMKKSEEKEKSSPMKPIPLPIVKQIGKLGKRFEEKLTGGSDEDSMGSDSSKSMKSTDSSGGDSEETLSVEEAKEKRRLKMELDKLNLARKLSLLELPLLTGSKKLPEAMEDSEP